MLFQVINEIKEDFGNEFPRNVETCIYKKQVHVKKKKKKKEEDNVWNFE